MKNIVKIENNEAKVSIEDIASFSGVQKRAIIRTIRSNQVEFSRFGNLRLSKETTNIGKLLNESETTFLLTLLKNTKEVVKFKSNLVYQFYKMREQICETNKTQLEQKDTQLKIAQKEVKEAKRKIHAYPRNGGFESVTRLIKDYKINITPFDLNQLLVEKGYLSVEVVKINHYKGAVMSGNIPLVHTDTILKMLDEMEVKRGEGYVDTHPFLFEE